MGLLEDYKKELDESSIPPRSKESQRWYLEKVSEIKASINLRAYQVELMQLKSLKTPFVGRMFTFFYDPKGKNTLPYFDRFPLIFMVGINEKTFFGINLHYLPLDLRQQLFYRLLERVNKNVYDPSTFIRIDYEYLKSFRKLRAYKPCFKQYAISNVRGKIINVPSSEWETAMYLPTAWWKRMPEEVVHQKSRREYNNNA